MSSEEGKTREAKRERISHREVPTGDQTLSFASGPGAVSETWDGSRCFRSFERNRIEKEKTTWQQARRKTKSTGKGVSR